MGYFFMEGQAFPDIASYPKNGTTNWCDLQAGQKVIFIGLPNVTQSEITTVKTGTIEFGAFKQDNILVLTTKLYQKGLEPTTTLGFECMYHPNIDGQGEIQDYSLDVQPLVEDYSLGMGVSVVLFDTATGIVKALRVCRLSNTFSLELLKMLEIVNKANMTKNEWFSTINQLQRHSPEVVNQFATIRYTDKGI